MRHAAVVTLSILATFSILISTAGADEVMNKNGISISKEPFGKTTDGKSVELYTLQNRNGVKVGIMTYGGIVVSIETPDKNGQMDDVVLGFDTIDPYLKGHPFFGALTGRYCNRIGGAKFTLDGKEYQLAKNNGENCLHGGNVGFDKKVWNAEVVEKDGVPTLQLSYLSKDGEENFPGNLQCTVNHSLDNDNALKFEYIAETDKATPISLTNHSYFNLAGHKNKDDVLGHVLTIHADKYTPVDDTLIPTGDLEPVAETPLDFTTPHKIGERIEEEDEQLALGGGYDHNFVINNGGSGLVETGKVVEPKTGRVMEFSTTKPGVQLYTGNFLNTTGKGGKTYGPRTGFCLETQFFPDSPNKPEFPSSILRPGEEYHHVTIYTFSVEK